MDNPNVVVKQINHSMKHPDDNIRFFPGRQMNEIHFSVRGPQNTIFHKGWYHGVLLLPKEYPFKPPNVRLLTKSGRFETNTNLCFSFTSFHPESWSPAVNLNAIIIALQSLFDDWDERAVGMITFPSKSEIAKCAEKSKEYECQICGAKHKEINKQMA
uniref:Ubiquitin-conjugating enzyme E2 n=1 Tax=Trepomonas sp. PC1 TaxID=1076344 RepID=A0A146K5A8_9EUKA|eukprot:JAP90751.1 Ubiquitin-conjugating enzyme E2 [Trepomonas sp. PC1]